MYVALRVVMVHRAMSSQVIVRANMRVHVELRASVTSGYSTDGRQTYVTQTPMS